MLSAVNATRLLEVGRAHGLDAVGVTKAEPFESTLAILEERKSAGLHGSMQFTYRNPPRSADPSRALPGAASLIVGARGYLQAMPQAGEGVSARSARYVWDDNYELLRDGLRAMAAVLSADGWRTRLLVDDNALVDREAAYRAGIGWYGKNANLLLPGRGSWFVLGSLLTNAPIPENEELVPDGCGTCSRCIDDCPTQAIIAPGVVDARRCLAWLVQDTGVFPVEFREALGDRLYGCDDCQEVCPINGVAERKNPPAQAASNAVWFDLLALLEASDEELTNRYGSWYIPRRDPNYLRRNALVVLANVGEGSDESTARTVGRYLESDDPMLRAHAVWAADRLGLHDALHAVAHDDNPMVISELDRLSQ